MEQHNHKRALVPQGSDIKLAITVTSLGDGHKVTDADVSLTVVITVGSHSETFQKSALKQLSDDTLVLPLATAVFPKGDMFITTTTSIPDEDFADNTRNEVQTNDTGVTII